MKMDDRELLEKMGISDEQIEEWCRQVENGTFFETGDWGPAISSRFAWTDPTLGRHEGWVAEILGDGPLLLLVDDALNEYRVHARDLSMLVPAYARDTPGKELAYIESHGISVDPGYRAKLEAAAAEGWDAADGDWFWDGMDPGRVLELKKDAEECREGRRETVPIEELRESLGLDGDCDGSRQDADGSRRVELEVDLRAVRYIEVEAERCGVSFEEVANAFLLSAVERCWKLDAEGDEVASTEEPDE